MTDDADGMFGVAPALQEATHVDIPDLPLEEGARSPIQVLLVDRLGVVEKRTDKASMCDCSNVGHICNT